MVSECGLASVAMAVGIMAGSAIYGQRGLVWPVSPWLWASWLGLLFMVSECGLAMAWLWLSASGLGPLLIVRRLARCFTEWFDP